MSITATTSWLKAASAIVVFFGVLVGCAALPALSGPTALLGDLIFWPLDGAQDFTSPEVRVFCAISGGVMFGWGILLWQIVGQVFPENPKLGRSLILTSVIAWFIVDSTGSLAAGAPLNAGFNVVFLLLFLVPLMCMRQLD